MEDAFRRPCRVAEEHLSDSRRNQTLDNPPDLGTLWVARVREALLRSGLADPWTSHMDLLVQRCQIAGAQGGILLGREEAFRVAVVAVHQGVLAVVPFHLYP